MNPYPRSTWRLLVDGPAEGVWNMAVDEAILGSVGNGESPPTLRFYAWSPPCLSLGRTQAAAQINSQTCREAGVTCVQRPTGGRAILHRDELTYSICLPLEDPRAAGDIVESYRRISEGLAKGLQSLGLPVQRAEPCARDNALSAACFDTPAGHEITVGGRKLVGSAQLRSRGMLLQHGSLPLLGDVAGIVDYLALEDQERERLRTRLQATATTLQQAAGREILYEEARLALCEGIARMLNVILREDTLSPKESTAALMLCETKYRTLNWRAGSRPQRRGGTQ